MKRIRDPIHKTIRLSDAALAVVDSARFQRLRHLHQLGMARLVYPGANHTRFEHSLGAHHVAQRAAEALDLGPEDAQDVSLAALLHDVGHGPMSHLSESLMAEFLGKHHAEVSREAVLGNALTRILEAHGADAARIGDLIVGKGPLSQLVAGELDCDRMDYLARDSYYTGVASAVDPQRIVQSFSIIDDGTIALREDAVTNAEAFLVTWYAMHTSVYYHATCRVAELMVARAARYALEAGEIKPEDLPRMDDVAFTYTLRHSTTDAWRLMLMVDQRRLFKVAREFDHDALGDDAARLLAKDRTLRVELERDIASEIGVKPADVFVDAPDVPTLAGSRANVLREDGTIEPLQDASRLVHALARAHLEGWRLRVVVPASKRRDAKMVAEAVMRKRFG